MTQRQGAGTGAVVPLDHEDEQAEPRLEVIVANDRAEAKPHPGAPAGRTDRRAERRVRRSERRAGVAGAKGTGPATIDDAPSTPATIAAEPRGDADDAAATEADAGAAGSGDQQARRRGAKFGLVPVVPAPADGDGESPAGRATARFEQQRRAAETALAGIDPQQAAIAPLVRYLNMVSLQLSEANLALGRLQAERDALRQQVIGLDAQPVEIPVDPQVETTQTEIAARHAALARLDLRQERRHDRAHVDEPKDEPKIATDDAIADTSLGRRRRIIALAVLAVIGAFLIVVRLHPEWGIEPSKVSKDSLGALPMIGNFMQVFLIGWLLFRVARIGGRGMYWLFPEKDPKAAKKRRR